MTKIISAVLIASIGIFISCDSATNNVVQEGDNSIDYSKDHSIIEKLLSGKSLTDEEWDILFNVIDTDTLAIRLIEGKYLGSGLNSGIDKILNILMEDPSRYNELINFMDSTAVLFIERQNINVKLGNSIRKIIKEKINNGWINSICQKYNEGNSLPTMVRLDDIVNFMKAGKLFGSNFDDLANTIIQSLDRLDIVTYEQIEKSGSLYREKLDELSFLDSTDLIKDALVRDFKSELNERYLDELFVDAARLVVSSQMASVSLIQRKYSIGYVRAGRIMDQLEAANIVGPNLGTEPRKILISDEDELAKMLYLTKK